MAGAYERFLASGDATVWTDCLLECEQRLLAVAGDAAAAGELLAQALLISIYARWLGSESGALAQRKTVRASCARLLPQLRDLHRRAPSPATRRAWGEVLAARGERAAALRLLGDAAFQVAEMVPVLMPADHAERATLLRPHVAGPAQRPFAPVVFCYCHALIALGAVRHARAALDASAMRQSDPLAIDLLGKIHESAGSSDAGRASLRRLDLAHPISIAHACATRSCAAPAVRRRRSTPGRSATMKNSTARCRKRSDDSKEISVKSSSRATQLSSTRGCGIRCRTGACTWSWEN